MPEDTSPAGERVRAAEVIEIDLERLRDSARRVGKRAVAFVADTDIAEDFIAQCDRTRGPWQVDAKSVAVHGAGRFLRLVGRLWFAEQPLKEPSFGR